MDEPKTPAFLDLMETGTRYDHYQELKELFMLGVDAIDRLTFKSEGDLQKKREFGIAVTLIQRRLDLLSNMEKKTAWHSELFTTLRQIDVDRKLTQLLLKATDEIPKKEEAN